MKLVIVMLSVAVLLAPAFAAGGKTISRAAAQKTALDLVKGGIVKDAELEKEEGKEVWSFDISSGSVIREIWIDAQSGLIVQHKVETKPEEKAEKAKDKAEAKAARKAKHISREAAEKAALELVKGGVVKEGELEKEKGMFIWSFDIQDGETTREVWIDALTGKPVMNTVESKAEADAEDKK